MRTSAAMLTRTVAADVGIRAPMGDHSDAMPKPDLRDTESTQRIGFVFSWGLLIGLKLVDFMTFLWRSHCP